MTYRILWLCLATTFGLSPVAPGQTVLIPATSNRVTPTVHAVNQVLPSVVNISTDRQVIVQYKYQIGAVTYRSRPQADHRQSLGSGIVIEFDEDIARTTIEVQADGAKIGNWPAERDGGKVTMNPAAGAELVNETKYTVVGTVEDAAGNESDVSITFTTAAKQ